MRLLLTADPEIEVPPRLYGGIERIVDVLVRRLRAAGHTVGLMARPGSECPADAFFPWPGLSSLSRRDTLSNMSFLWRAARTFKPDLVHSFSRVAYLLPLLRGRTPLVMSYQREPTLRTAGLAVKLAKPGVLTFATCSPGGIAFDFKQNYGEGVIAWQLDGQMRIDSKSPAAD